MIAKAFALTMLCSVFVAMFWGIRARLKPWESRWVPWIVVGGLAGAMLAVALWGRWYNKSVPPGGVEDRYCEGSSCPPERPEEL